MKMNDKDRVNLKCQDCGTIFDISYGRYRRKPVDNYWRCPKCVNIQRSLVFVNLTDEERLALREQRSNAAKKVWESLNSDELMRRCISQQLRWDKLTLKQRQKMLIKTREGNERYQNLPETKAKLAMRNAERWRNMSKEERDKEIERLSIIRDQYWESLSDHEKYLKMEKMWRSQVHVGPTEYMFNDKIHDMGFINGRDYFWGYSTYPCIHPEYYLRFGKINPITCEENFPYHSWDFILFPQSNVPILIDIDGSAHDPKLMHFRRRGNQYSEREKIDYNDSQRPYQVPDGMSAYVIQAFNDTIDGLTRVINIISGENMTYSNLISIISDRFTPDDLSDNV